MKGLDFSWGRPGGAATKAAGFDFVMRYCPYPGDGGKGLTSAEIAEYQANGLGIGIVFESTAGRMRDGYEAGRADARQVLTSRSALGFPPELPTFFACDEDAPASIFATLDEYLNGAASWLGKARVGVYGSFAVVKHCLEAGTARYAWQTYAWSRGKVYEGNTCFQYSNGETVNGAAVDYNEADGDTSWLWWPEEEEMPDPRVDAIIAALTGDPQDAAGKLAAWNAHGNSLLAGYALQQDRLGAVVGASSAKVKVAYEGVKP